MATKMKLLVTGGLGFIGSNLVEHLVRDGHEVVVLDNMHTGSEENISAVREKVTVHKKNAGDIASLGEKFDAIFHQGVYSSSPMYKKEPHLTARVIDEWISVLEFARKNDCKLVFASSSSAYNGNPPPHHEDMEIKITDYYTEARYAMERLAKLYYDLYSLKSVGLRYFSVYGPHEKSKGKYANLVTQFLWDIQAGKAPVILGDGSQTRDFTYVDDVVNANLLALKYLDHDHSESESSGSGGHNDHNGHTDHNNYNNPNGADVFNVGTGKSVSLNEVIRLLNKKLGTSVKAAYEPNKIKNYVQHTLADTSKAKSELGFSASISLEEGIGRIINYYSSR